MMLSFPFLSYSLTILCSLTLRRAFTCVYTKVAALKRIKWKYLFAFSFWIRRHGVLLWHGNEYMEGDDDSPLFFRLLILGGGRAMCGCGNRLVERCDWPCHRCLSRRENGVERPIHRDAPSLIWI